VEKVLHGADYDIRTLGRDYAITFTNLFDTMIAAQLIGLEAFGLAALLKSHFDITLNKQWQKADWSARPLTPAMIRYAADDTAHLFALRDRLADGLAHKGRLEWLREECRLLTAQKAAARQPPSCFAVKGAGRLEPQQQAILQALLEAREAIASTTDRPPFKIITNETLMELSVRQPAAIEQLAAMPGVGRRALQQWGAGLLEAIRCGAAVPPEQRPRRAASRYVSLTGAQDAMLKRMKTAREEAATRLGISPGLLCSNAVMEELTRLSQPTAAQLAQRLTQWRYEIMGDTFLKMLAGPNSM
jgi:ribonuclease D